MDTLYRIEWDTLYRWVCPICDEHNQVGMMGSYVCPQTMFNLGFNPYPGKTMGGDRTRFECLRCRAHFFTERYLEDCTYTLLKPPEPMLSRLELLLDVA